MRTLSATLARRHFSRLLKAVLTGPVQITSRGTPVGYIVSYKDNLHAQALKELATKPRKRGR